MNLTQRAEKWVEACLASSNEIGATVGITMKHASMPSIGDKIFSWGEHWVLAEYDAKHKLFVINSSRYSVSTYNHYSKVYWAIRNSGAKFIELPFASSGWSGCSTCVLHPSKARHNIKLELKGLRVIHKRGRVGSMAHCHRERTIKDLQADLVKVRKLESKGW